MLYDCLSGHMCLPKTKLLRLIFKSCRHIRRGRLDQNENPEHESQVHKRTLTNATTDQLTNFKEVVGLINEESNRFITWSLGIVGGSILMLIGSDYTKPSGWILYFYFLFVAGWICLGVSVWYGVGISRNRMVVPDKKTIEEIIRLDGKIDKRFRRQISFLYAGLIPFFIWLTAFLFWFVLNNNNHE